MQDFWPTGYFPFMNRTYDVTNLDTAKKRQYEIQSLFFMEDVLSYLVTNDFITNSVLADEVSDMVNNGNYANSEFWYGAYSVSQVAYAPVFGDTDPAYLTDTIFIALNMQACQASNIALLETSGDPGGMLAWLETELADAATAGNTAIIAGSISPGDESCNRQWSMRYAQLVDTY